MVRFDGLRMKCLNFFAAGDVKNPKLSVALNHFQTSTIMSSFQNMTSFPNHNITEFPFNDSIRWSPISNTKFNTYKALFSAKPLMEVIQTLIE